MRYLKLIGVQSMHISPDQPGRVRSFLGLAHTVIIYRTAIGPELLEDIIDSGAKILFEFDDLVVGPTALENSGILAQVSEQDALLLRTLSVEFLRTALNCHGIIVSSDYLAELYAKRENGLAEKPFYILPNFLETDIYREPGSKDFTFAYTSPSSSIRSELTMLSDFLARYDAVASRKWSILVMGNEKAMNELEKGNFRCGRVVGHPFAAFDDYLTAITKAETVLIPLADNDFNRSKTPIRLMDAAVSGTQALFSPVGSYTLIKEYLLNDSLCIDAQDWPKVGGTIAPALDALSENVIDLQQAVRQVYGVAAAESCYLRVFIDQIGLDPFYVSDRLTSR